MQLEYPEKVPATKEEFISEMTKLNPEATAVDLVTAWIQRGEGDLIDKIVLSMQAYGEQLVEDMQAHYQGIMQEKLAEKENEFVMGITRGLGLDKDPVVHLSDVKKVVREIALETIDSKKKSQTGDGDDRKEKDGDEDPTNEKPKTLSQRLKEAHEHGRIR